jgi:hypothetical protein
MEAIYDNSNNDNNPLSEQQLEREVTGNEDEIGYSAMVNNCSDKESGEVHNNAESNELMQSGNDDEDNRSGLKELSIKDSECRVQKLWTKFILGVRTALKHDNDHHDDPAYWARKIDDHVRSVVDRVNLEFKLKKEKKSKKVYEQKLLDAINGSFGERYQFHRKLESAVRRKKRRELWRVSLSITGWLRRRSLIENVLMFVVLFGIREVAALAKEMQDICIR